MKKRASQEGIRLLVRLARFKKEMRKLEPVTYPVWVKKAAKLQGITIKD